MKIKTEFRCSAVRARETKNNNNKNHCKKRMEKKKNIYLNAIRLYWYAPREWVAGAPVGRTVAA